MKINRILYIETDEKIVMMDQVYDKRNLCETVILRELDHKNNELKIYLQSCRKRGKNGIGKKAKKN